MAEIVNDLNNQAHAKSDDANNQNEENAMMITPLQQDELDHTMETLSKKNFTDDEDFDPLLLKLSEKITQNKPQTMQHSSIYNSFK